jgi:hypothetical protein
MPSAPAAGRALLIALPTAAGFGQLVSDHLANGGGSGNRTAINVHQARWAGIGDRRIGTLIRRVDGGRGGVHAFACDGANGRARRKVGGGVAGCHDIGSAAGVVPVGSVVTAHAKVRGPHDFQVVCGAGVADREVIRRRVGGLGVLVGERCIGVSYDLAVAVVFHHDHEHVIERRNSSGSVAPLGEHGSCEHGQQAQS